MKRSISGRVITITCFTLVYCRILVGCQSVPTGMDGDGPLLPDMTPPLTSSDPPSEDPSDDTADNASAEIIILKNGRVVANPAYPHKSNKYHFEESPGDNDLPWLRQYAIDHNIFSGINMSLEWKDREWDMMKAIIHHTSHVLPFTGINSDPDPDLLFRAKSILSTAGSHPGNTWACGSIAQSAVGLAQAHGIPARMINGRPLEDPCAGGDYCCEMFSTRWNRWIFLMPHVYAWIEHETDGPLGAAELRQYDLDGFIQATPVPQHNELVLDAQGNWNLVSIPFHYQAVPHPPLVFMPSVANVAPTPPYIAINWWEGYFHRVALSYTTTTQQQYPIMAEVFNDDFLNHTPCFNFDPIPVIPVDNPDITYPLNNVEASVELVQDVVMVHLVTNIFDLVEFQRLGADQLWHSIEVLTDTKPGFLFVWHPTPLDVLTLRGINVAGVTSPEVVIHYSGAAGDLNADGKTNGLDLQHFVQSLTSGSAEPGVTRQGDFDGDSRITMNDLPYMISTLLDQ
jgi:hypothetical protein